MLYSFAIKYQLIWYYIFATVLVNKKTEIALTTGISLNRVGDGKSK